MALIFLDLETTGLDPQTSRILEIAAARVDNQLNPVSGFTAIVRPIEPVERLPIVDKVREMHTVNGLLAEIAGPAAIRLMDVAAPFLAWIDAQGPETHTLAGDSVHFDMSFLRVWLPYVAARFSHRLLDVSAFRVAREYRGMPECPVQGGGHRAQSDTLASIAKARWHLSRITA